MTITMNTLAAALVAAMSIGTAASAAEGEYYEGAGSATTRFHADPLMTGSIGSPTPRHMPTHSTVDRGDYYPGASRDQ